MAVAVGALVVSVGGNVTAAVLITSADIQDNTIRSVDIREGTVASGDVANATLTGTDVANGSFTGADLADGSVGSLDVANNSLSGADVNESRLGVVPSAASAASAQDADRLDGVDSTGFVRGRGSVQGAARSIPANTSEDIREADWFGFFGLQYECPANFDESGLMHLENISGSPAHVFIDRNGIDDPVYQLLPAGATLSVAAFPEQSFHIQAHGSPGVLTLDVATVHHELPVSNCHTQAQGLLTRL